MKRLARCFAFLVCCGLVLPAYGVTCNIVSALVTFASYDPIGANRTTDKTVLGTIQITCDGATSVTISVAVGTGTFATRTMGNGGNTLNYNLFADAGYSQVWGDGTSGTVMVPCVFSSSGTQSIPVYGKIPKGQSTAAVGTYNATPQITISWP
jgi:spore coat protein U-like protein